MRLDRHDANGCPVTPMSDPADLTTVSVEHDGRIFSGVGVSEDSLSETIDARETPAEPETVDSGAPAGSHEPAESAAPSETRDPKTGQFTKPTRGQKRFDQLTFAQKEAERRADAAEARASELEARLNQQPREQSPPPQHAAQESPTPQVQATRAKPVEDEVGAKYATYADFVEDLADWKAEQRLAAMNFDARFDQRIEADRAARQRADHYREVFTRARRTYPDFDAVLTTHQVTFPDLRIFDQLPNLEHVLYALAKDEQLARKIAQLSQSNPVLAGLELARLSPSSSVASPASTGRTAGSPVPPPYQPVGSGSQTASPSSAEIANRSGDDYDSSGYRERRAAERKGGRR